MSIWYWLVHVGGVDYGLAYGHWAWYNFWSGIAGSFFIGALVYLVLWYPHHSCHYSWKCFRLGKHEAAGGTFKLCWKHHPDMGTRPDHALITKLHLEHKAREAAG